jgi:ribosomal protein S18 acetylase RimI-like enzyme
VLHAQAIDEGFLSSLGPSFLTLLYRRMVRDARSFVVVAEDDGVVVGHAGATEDVGHLYRQFLLRDGFIAGAVAAPRLLRQWRSVLETLRYPSGDGDLPEAELLAVAVSDAFRGRGLGRALVGAVNEELVRRGIGNARVVVAESNAPALRLYQSSGFRPSASIEVHAHATSQVLTWS